MRKGIYFIRLALNTFCKSGRCLKLFGRYILVALLIILIFLIPFNLLLLLLDVSPLSLVLIGVLTGLCLFTLIVWADISSLTVAALFDQQQHGDEPNLAAARTLPKTRWKDMLAFDLRYPSLLPARILADNSGKANPKHDWLAGLFLVKTILALESFELKETPARIREMLEKNLLRFNPGLIKVKRVSTLVFVLGLLVAIGTGVWLGFAAQGMGMISPLQRMLAGSLGFASAAMTILPALRFNACARIMYHTSIYRWMINLEEATRNQPQVAIPPLLSKVLSR